MAANSQPEGQIWDPWPESAGDGAGVIPDRGVNKAVGEELFMPVVDVLVGTDGSVPVMARNRNRTRVSEELVSSPRNRKFGVLYGLGKPSNLL